ncbi:MAG: hypothetical protein WBK26_11785 [Burkholderiaceae bacterium]
MPALKTLAYKDPGATVPAQRLLAITKADADLDYVCRMLYVGTGGDVVVRDLATGATITHKNVGSGTYLGPFLVDRVTTATTATDIVGYV